MYVYLVLECNAFDQENVKEITLRILRIHMQMPYVDADITKPIVDDTSFILHKLSMQSEHCDSI